MQSHPRGFDAVDTKDTRPERLCPECDAFLYDRERICPECKYVMAQGARTAALLRADIRRAASIAPPKAAA